MEYKMLFNIMFVLIMLAMLVSNILFFIRLLLLKKYFPNKKTLEVINLAKACNVNDTENEANAYLIKFKKSITYLKISMGLFLLLLISLFGLYS